jgi:hypothetical protein
VVLGDVLHQVLHPLASGLHDKPQLKVADADVRLDAVLVVDILTRRETAAEVLFHHVYVIQNPAAVRERQAAIAVLAGLDAALHVQRFRKSRLASATDALAVKFAIGACRVTEALASVYLTWSGRRCITALLDLPGWSRLAVCPNAPAVHRAETARL